MLAVVTICSVVLAVVMAMIAWRGAHAERRRSDARVEALAAAIRANPYAETEKGSRQIFQPHARRGFAPILATCLIFVGAGAALVVVASSPRGVATGAPAALPALPLELRELTSERTGGDLVIKGIVRNPSSAPVAGLTAVATLFDHSGQVSATGRSVVDGALLAAGAESAFVVRVPAPDDVDKYRVSFRTSVPDDRVLPHIDRRDARNKS